ncbi:hypothetical protein A3193_18535 [Candidatus Thiodiazotropha endoloripes]|uniref:hypothetical protein n=1 Tax=Candidatus Thiodiazotropha endoloripes TaxID=1818881 RepID=UPI00083E2C93|nr:hypothetical protein [Candidatus Thiodiazotropha endoloripes]ODB82747.1 hypothetical protein A3193_18535 [Candidatus Thiodiazotropha endoloripes]
MAKGVKTGGRQKGTPNKDKQPLLDALEGKWPGYHPVIAMAEIANDEKLPKELRFQAHKEVAQYIEPKKKAVELSQGSGEPFIFRMGFDG